MSIARVRALVVVGALFVSAVVLVTMAVLRDTQTVAQARATGCPPGQVPADLRLPEEKNIKINVLNGTRQAGLAEQVAEDFQNREFVVVKPPSTDRKGVNGVAVLRYGPKAVGAAHVLRAYFLNQAEPQFDIKRTSDVVDVVVGNRYRQLGTITEVNQSIGALGKPQLPKGTCDAYPR
ncbi:MAG TPA: LytR C-terminal domain-containing protein [Micromonosporaceae bacterium]|nr:LytR C-terminal domain-containing protein [Micromonosporaceae bacterium]